MDLGYFDVLTRALTDAGSWRKALGTLLGGALGLLSLDRPNEAAAGRACNPICGECQLCRKGPCKKTKHGKKCKKGVCQAQENGTGCSGGTCQGGSCVAPRASPTCSDGVKNGSESDVDCGGSCPRCANDKLCTTRTDCVGGLCAGGRCQACAVDDDCGEDADSQCYCAPPATGSSNVCTKANQTGPNVTTCTACPLGTFCFDDAPNGFFCFKPCGAPN